jgi:PTS system nitrogen regulatory IIA component
MEDVMKVMDFLPKKAISADLKGSDKQEILSELLDLLISAGEIDKKYKNKLMEVLLAREALGSTAIGQGIGIPHGKSENVSKLVAAFGLSRSGVNFDSLDGEPVYLFFLLIAPQDSAGPHLKALARISRLLKDKYFRDKLKSARDEATILKVIAQEDERKI